MRLVEQHILWILSCEGCLFMHVNFDTSNWYLSAKQRPTCAPWIIDAGISNQTIIWWPNTSNLPKIGRDESMYDFNLLKLVCARNTGYLYHVVCYGLLTAIQTTLASQPKLSELLKGWLVGAFRKQPWLKIVCNHAPQDLKLVHHLGYRNVVRKRLRCRSIQKWSTCLVVDVLK